MEFPFDVRRILRPDSSGISVVYSREARAPSRELSMIIDNMGSASARAQRLGSIITTSVRFFSLSDNKLYFKVQDNKVLGFLKTGTKNLFYTDEHGRMKEITPLCLLDFYVHEDVQRSGFGKELYEAMLAYERTSPNKIAIDRPSPKLISFMRKHYNLSSYIPQNNNYVIYREYFTVWNI